MGCNFKKSEFDALIKTPKALATCFHSEIIFCYQNTCFRHKIPNGISLKRRI